jgi:NADH-quinone oxidoreductase subunit C
LGDQGFEPDDVRAREQADADELPDTLHGVAVTSSRGQMVLHPARGQFHDLVDTLRDEGYLTCIDLCAVDYLTHPGRHDLPEGTVPERFEVVVGLRNHRERTMLRLRVQVPESDPVVPSLVDLHPGADAMEREAFDMFGVRFDGHPDLTRILMPESWEGHPLRKDAASGRVPVQFKGAPGAR